VSRHSIANPIQHRIDGATSAGACTRAMRSAVVSSLAAGRTAEQGGAIKGGTLPRFADVERDRFGSTADLVGGRVAALRHRVSRMSVGNEPILPRMSQG
jgi:hypothetical protein